MVLVYTSVWIRFLANRAPFAKELDALLSLDEVVGHELVYGELLIGDRGERKKLLAAYEKIHQASTIPHSDVVALVSPSISSWARRRLDRHSPTRVGYCRPLKLVDS